MSDFLTCKFEHLSFDQHDKHDRMLVIRAVDSNVGRAKSNDWHQLNLIQHHQPPEITSLPTHRTNLNSLRTKYIIDSNQTVQ